MLEIMVMMDCSLYEAEVMTLREYSFEKDKHMLKNLKKNEDMHLQAFLNHVVTDKEKSGKGTKPKYPKFSDFYDSEKEYRKLTEPEWSEQDKKVINLFALANAI